MAARVLTKIGPKYQVVIPRKIRETANLKVGDFVEASFGPQGVLLKPKVVVDRPLDAALDEAMADVAAGRVSKSFRSARALVRDIKGRGGRARTKK